MLHPSGRRDLADDLPLRVVVQGLTTLGWLVIAGGCLALLGVVDSLVGVKVMAAAALFCALVYGIDARRRLTSLNDELEEMRSELEDTKSEIADALDQVQSLETRLDATGATEAGLPPTGAAHRVSSESSRPRNVYDQSTSGISASPSRGLSGSQAMLICLVLIGAVVAVINFVPYKNFPGSTAESEPVRPQVPNKAVAPTAPSPQRSLQQEGLPLPSKPPAWQSAKIPRLSPSEVPEVSQEISQQYATFFREYSRGNGKGVFQLGVLLYAQYDRALDRAVEAGDGGAMVEIRVERDKIGVALQKIQTQ